MSIDNRELKRVVYKKGFNIYMLLNQYKKETNHTLPEEVIQAVCISYLRCKDQVAKQYPWFVTAVKEELRKFYAKKSQERAKELKQQPIHPLVKGLVDGLPRTWYHRPISQTG